MAAEGCQRKAAAGIGKISDRAKRLGGGGGRDPLDGREGDRGERGDGSDGERMGGSPVSLKGVTKVFPARGGGEPVTAVDAVSFEVKAGGLITLPGASARG